MSRDKINLGDVVQGVWDNYYYLVVSIDKATILICYSKIYNVFENQAKLKEKRKCLTATAR